MSTHKQPKVSVVMSVYNGEKYLEEAIDSILNQTFEDFEFIIIDDGSTDRTLRIIKGYKDPRIVLISRENRGLVKSLNEGIEKAKGEYIARMDADDISMKDRLKKQVDFLDNDKRVVLLGSSMGVLYSKSKQIVNHFVLLGDTELRAEMFIRCPFVHGSTMYRRSSAVDAGLYNSNYWPAEDYHFWLRLSMIGKISNLYEPLYVYRENDLGISSLNNASQQNKTKDVIKLAYKNINKLIHGRIGLSKYYRYNEGIGLIERISDIYTDIDNKKNIHMEYTVKKRYVQSIIIRAKVYIILYKILRKIYQWNLIQE